jgi:hypothetical protein
VITARRGWVEKKDVVNTLPTDQFLASLRAKPGTAKGKAVKRRSA